MEILEFPCYKKSCKLGDLYSAVTGKFFSESIANREQITSASETYAQPSTSVDLLTEDDLSDKTKLIGMGVELTLGFLAGLVEVGGSAKFLIETKKSAKSVRITLRYKCTTKFEHLSTSQLTSLNESGKATHVVVGVLHGANAYFVFESKVTRDKTYSEVEGGLKVAVGCFLAKATAKVTVGVSHTKDLQIENITCTCYSEGLKLESANPTFTFAEAKRAFSDLPSKIDEDTVVPQRVWVIPLSYLPDVSKVNIVQNIRPKILDQAMQVIDYLTMAESEVQDLMMSETCSKFPTFKNTFDRMAKMITDYRKQLAFNFANGFETGNPNESQIATILDQHHCSPFANSNLQPWILSKKREVTLLEACFEFLNESNITYVTEHGLGYCMWLKFCFFHDDTIFDELSEVLKTKDNEEHPIKTLEEQKLIVEDEARPNNSLPVSKKEGKTKEFQGNKKVDEWYDNPAIINDMQTKIRRFTSFAKANNKLKSSKITFGIREMVGNTEYCEKAVVISMESTEAPICPYNPIGPPGKPLASLITHNSMVITWSKPEYGSENVENYSVLYRLDHEEEWNICATCSSEVLEIQVSNLFSRAKYRFKVQAETDIGAVSEFSDTSDPFETLRSDIAQMYDLKPIVKDGTRSECEIANGRKVFENAKVKIVKFEFGCSKPCTESKALLLLSPPNISKIHVAERIVNHVFGIGCSDDYRLKLPYDADKSDWVWSYLFHWQDGFSISYSLNVIIAPDFQLPFGGICADQLKPFCNTIKLIAFVINDEVVADPSLKCHIRCLFSLLHKELCDSMVLFNNPNSIFDKPFNITEVFPGHNVSFRAKFDVCEDAPNGSGDNYREMWYAVAKGCSSMLKFVEERQTISLESSIEILERQEKLFDCLEKIDLQRKEIALEFQEIKKLDTIPQIKDIISHDPTSKVKDGRREKYQKVKSQCECAERERIWLSSMTIMPSLLFTISGLNELEKLSDGSKATVAPFRNVVQMLENYRSGKSLLKL